MYLYYKILGGMANRADPDLEKSDLDLHCWHVILSELVYEILGQLPYIYASTWALHYVQTAKAQIRLHIHSVWSVPTIIIKLFCTMKWFWKEAMKALIKLHQ